MSLNIEMENILFTATNELSEILEKDDPMIIFSKEIHPRFKDSDFIKFYSNKGRNGISPSLLAMITLLQFKENLSDEETVRACLTRIDWKIALHLPLRIKQGDFFVSETLCMFRKRLKENGEFSLIFDKILDIAIEKGFLKKNGKHRIDATHVLKHVNRISTTDLLFRAVRKVVSVIEINLPEYYLKKVPESIRERYENTFSSFGLSKEKRADKQAEIVEDGLYIEKIILESKINQPDILEQLHIMKTIFQENVIITEKQLEKTTFIEVVEIQTPKQSIFIPEDTTIQLGRKGKLSWVGEKCHIVETAEKGKINFIIGIIPQTAYSSDQLIHDRLRSMEESRGFHPASIYADGNYISGREIKNYEMRGQRLMGYIGQDNAMKHPDFKLEKFKLDLKNKTAVCPAGKKSISHNVYEDENIIFNFSAHDCKACSFKQYCLGGNQRSRKINVSAHYEYITKRRKEQRTQKFKEEMKIRSPIEGTISELVRSHGFRKIKYKKKSGREFQYYMSASALNLKRLFKAMKFKFKS